MPARSNYPYTVTDPPGVNVRRFRTALGISQRILAERCRPALDHTTIRRLELNLGYTQDTLERVSVALGVAVSTLFLPPELAEWPSLSASAKARIADAVADAAAAAHYRKRASS